MSKLIEELKHKFVLLDNGVLTRWVDHFDYFENFLGLLSNADCKPIFIPPVEFGFMRGAFSQEHILKRREFLDSVSASTLDNPTNDIYKDAIKIANIYTKKKLFSPGFVDCCIASYLKKYSPNLLLATLNHGDFPTFLFDRIGCEVVDIEKDVLTVGFYRYNLVKAGKSGL